MGVSPVIDSGMRWQPSPAALFATPPQPAPPMRQNGYLPETSYHPQIAAQCTPSTGTPPSAAGGAYGIPAGSTLHDVASGTRAQPFDVTLSQLATAVYGTRGDPPEGWSAVTDPQLQELGVADPQAWRLQYLGANDTVPTNNQEFRAEVYTDGEGNYVLSYRGTAEGGPDWDNNFRQGLGYETNDGDKFSVTAVNTAVEFARVFGGNPCGPSTNLAITGHSQGGGLATVGSLASGVPAVTFDASGIHPNTWDRMGIDPQRARDIAEGGQIRAYSLSGDALTNAQDSWITGLVAPDALGTQIVVAPATADEHHMFTHYGPIEGFSPKQAEQYNTLTEIARDPVTGIPIGIALGGGGGATVGSLFGPQGTLVGAGLGTVLGPLLTTGAGNIAYAAISHSPNALTNAMIERQPWQAGYENPSNFGRDLQNLLPDELKDDFARNTHDFATDIDAVVANEFANGQYVQGGARLIGDFAEGAFNSVGDTVDRYADQAAAYVDGRIDGWVGDALAGTIDFAGDAVEFVADAGGQVVETLADGAGRVAQGVANFVGGLFGR